MTATDTIEFRDRASATLLRCLAGDWIVAESARVSTKGSQPASLATTRERDAGLIAALMRERHGTPFEHAVFTFLVEAPIFVARESHRHRIASISEESSRYRELRPIFYLPAPGRALTQVGKAMAYQLEPGTAEQRDYLGQCFRAEAAGSWARYRGMLNAGIAREVARMVLPVSIFTSWHLTINARSLLNFLSLRVRDDGAAFPSKPQIEIQHIAQDMETALAEHMPATHAAFVAGRRVAP